MDLAPSPASRFDAFLSQARDRDVLRFITCGSVDDGKSTLIGRMLHDTKTLMDDQVAALRRDSRRFGGGGLDFSLLVDGLAAERDQGITIDVAYRFFSTERRTFIVADAPGHEEYTRNMATGASTADAAVILVDARRGLTRQTRRHALLVAMLGIRRVVLAVNKMDLTGWSQSTFDEILAAFQAFAAPLGFEEVAAIPLSAKNGDNVALPAVAAPWYEGPTLIGHLEAVPTQEERDPAFRLPVQWVARGDTDYRGYAGLIASGAVEVGDRVRVSPSGRESAVARIVTADGDLPRAVAGQSVAVTLVDQIDASRGDVIGEAAAPRRAVERFEARVFWMGEPALRPGARFHLRAGAASALAVVEAVSAHIDLDSGAAEPAAELGANDIGVVSISVDRPLALDLYARVRDTGGFILVDRESADTAAIGLITAL